MEIRRASHALIRLAQQESFAQEISFLKENRCIHVKNRLTELQPYVDDNGILRVGGRLRKAEVSMTAQHQIILHAIH